MEKPMDSRTKISLEHRRLRFKLMQLKREALFTDVMITCHGKSLNVHKCILSASSIFFKLLLTDSRLQPIHSFDLTSLFKLEEFECLESIINFMYSGEIQIGEDNFALLACLAEFFSMSDLTGFCSGYLRKSLSVSNCLKLYFGMREIDAVLKATRFPVTVHQVTEVQDTIAEMLDTSFYKNILPQEQTLQITAEDVLHLLNRGAVKNFCIETALGFVVKWTKLHQDTGAFQIASLLVHQAFETVVSQPEPTQPVCATVIAGYAADIEDFLQAADVTVEAKTGVKLELDRIVQEVDKYDTGLREVKQEMTEKNAGDEMQDTGADDSTRGKDGVDDSIKEGKNNSDTDDYEPEILKPEILEETDNQSQIKTRKMRKTLTKIKMKFTNDADKVKEVQKAESKPDEVPRSQGGRKRSRKGKARKLVQVQYDTDTEEEEENEENISVTEDKSDEYGELDQEIMSELTKVLKKSVGRNSNGKFGCQVCDKEFARKHSLVLHMNSHTGTKPYRCVECGMLFFRSYHVIRHMRHKHSDKAQFECDVCGDEFSDPKSMVAHANTHNRELVRSNVEKVKREHEEVKVNEDGKDEYWCTLCNKQFSRRSHLHEHIMIHTGSRPFPCDNCKCQFKTQHDLNKHINTVHLGMKAKFKCDNCKRPYNSEVAYDKHVASCTGRGYHCDQCPASFHRQYHLDRHMATHSDDRPFTCPQCPRTFKHANKLKAHEKTHDKSSDDMKPGVICELCGAVLKDVKYLKRHMVSHTGVKPHKCPVCLKSYSQAAGLQVHMRQHTGARPFQCEICSMLFAVKSNLMRHQRRHRGDRRHKCDQCGKGFVMMGDLRRHYTVHTGEKNYACRYCGKKFSSNSKLPQHERIHTGEKPYECRVCGKRFIQSGDRTRHEAIHGVKAPPKSKSLFLCDEENQPDDKTGSETSVLVRGSRPAARRKSARSNTTGQGENSNSAENNEAVANLVLNSQLLSREPVRAHVPSQETVNSQSKSSTALNRDGREIQAVINERVDSNRPVITIDAMSYVGQDLTVATTQVANEVVIRDMYPSATVYTTQSSSGTFLASLSDSNFMQY